MYIIDISHLFPDYCEENTKQFESDQTRYFQIGEHLRLTVMTYEQVQPYFLLAHKDGSPVDRLEYLYLTEDVRFIYPNIYLPDKVEQWYNEETGVLHVRPTTIRTRSDSNWEA
ncbi:hypothetical protein [Atopococcus tabaci]|uniref:hypothetical protein n=1 Tax=Atopococcus tabaci TaxID=269774 RepID=UPI0024093073|nr:hypothetical protein [Atopococcus tabaci]